MGRCWLRHSSPLHDRPWAARATNQSTTKESTTNPPSSPQQRGGGSILHRPPLPVASHLRSLLQRGPGGGPVAGAVSSKACGRRCWRRRQQQHVRRAARKAAFAYWPRHAPLAVSPLPAENLARKFWSTARVMTMSGCSAPSGQQRGQGIQGGATRTALRRHTRRRVGSATVLHHAAGSSWPSHLQTRRGRRGRRRSRGCLALRPPPPAPPAPCPPPPPPPLLLLPAPRPWIASAGAAGDGAATAGTS